MPGLSLSEFFPAGAAAPNIAPRLAHAPPLSATPRHLLLYGPERCGKTTLLFHLAYSLASQGASVLIIGSRKRLEYNSLALAQGISPRDHCWASIQMKYIDDDSTLMQYASFLHLATPGPNVILIDDLDRLTAGGVGPSMPSTRYKDDGGTRSRDAALCRVLAVLCDSLEYISTVQGRPALLGVTASITGAADTPRSFHLYQRWLPLAVRCWHPGPPGSNNSGGSGSGRFRMATVVPGSNGGEGPSPTGWAADYSIAQGFSLEGVGPLISEEMQK